MRVEQEIVRARRYGSDLTLGLVDIDHFKKVNDSFGHPGGDAVLAHMASLLTASVRSSDIVARYGGEEFGLLLVEAAAPEANAVTERIRRRVEEHKFLLTAGDAIATTVSVGIAQMLPEDGVQSLLQRADAALYKAKGAGRNKVCVAE
jgi:diguanylate cyclase (GGDEF)-like protein